MSATTASVATTSSTNAGTATTTGTAAGQKVSMWAQPSSIRDTADRIDAAAREGISSHVITLANGKKYLIWATATVANGTQVSVSAPKRFWVRLGGQLKAEGVLTGNETEETILEVEKDQLKVSGNKSSSVPMIKEARNTIAAFKAFEKNAQYKTQYTPPTTASIAQKSASASLSGKDPKAGASQSTAKPATQFSDLESFNQAIQTTTVLAGLKHIQQQHLKSDGTPLIEISAPHEGGDNSNTPLMAWELNPDQNRFISDKHCLRSCVLPSRLTSPVYIPIRTNHYHYVGLLVMPDKRVYYYDSLGRPYTENSSLDTEIQTFCAVNGGLTINLEYIKDQNSAHQKDRVHCGVYQMRWYKHCCFTMQTLQAGKTPPDPYEYTTNATEMEQLRSILTHELGRKKKASSDNATNDRSSKKSPTASARSIKPIVTAAKPQNNSGVIIEEVTDEETSKPSPAATTSLAPGSVLIQPITTSHTPSIPSLQSTPLPLPLPIVPPSSTSSHSTHSNSEIDSVDSSTDDTASSDDEETVAFPPLSSPLSAPK